MIVHCNIPITATDGKKALARYEKGQVVDFPEDTEEQRQRLRFMLERGYVHDQPKNSDETEKFKTPTRHPMKKD